MLYSDEYLQSMRIVTDPVADQAVTELLNANEVNEVNHIFASLVRNDELPEFKDYDIAGYLEASRQDFPTQIDWDKVRIAQNIFLQYSSTIFLVLFCQSLPECYACWRGAEVLLHTGRLTNTKGDFKVFSRRLMETAQFMVDVLDGDGLKSSGQGLVSVQKVRLLHAAIRHLLREQGWKEDKFDAPINQEDMLGTLLSFSVTIIEGLDKLGAHLTNQEREAYYYFWTLIGPLMGVDPSHIPDTLTKAIFLKDRILEHQMGPSEAGRILTDAAIQYMQYMIPAKAFDKFPNRLMGILLDEKVAQAVGLDASSNFGGKMAMGFFRFGIEVQEHLGGNAPVRALTRKFEIQLLEAIFKHFNDHKEIEFRLPEDIRPDWDPKQTPSLGAPPTIRRIHFDAEDCHGVVPALERLIGKCKVDNNPIGFFASLYRLTTIKIVDAIDRGIFEDNERMARMDLVFARRYLHAVTQYLNAVRPTESWMTAFHAAGDPRVNVIQHLFLGMNAHINLDLSIAAAEIAPGEQIDSFANDFNRINAILKSLMDLTMTDISDIWPPLKGLLLIGKKVGKGLTGLAMVGERRLAWKKATQLAPLSGEALANAIREMDAQTNQYADEILYPGKLLGLIFNRITQAQRGSVRWQIEQFHDDLAVESK
ncbi:MAG: DUF5995 family protein [Bacteroidota bacterium]